MEAFTSGSIVTIPVSIKVDNAQTEIAANNVRLLGTGQSIKDAYGDFLSSLADALGLLDTELSRYELYWSEAAGTYCDTLSASILNRGKSLECKSRDAEDLDVLLRLMSPEERQFALSRSWSKLCRWRAKGHG